MLSRKEILEKVNRGEITQSDADDTFAAQIEESVEQKLERKLQVANFNTQLDQRIKAYEEALPELSNQGSELFTRVAAQYTAMLQLGLPNSASTQLAAVQAVVGPIEVVRSVAKGTRKVESHQEGGDPEGSEGGSSEVKGLSAKQRKYYTGLINRGIHKDWDEVKKLVGKA